MRRRARLAAAALPLAALVVLAVLSTRTVRNIEIQLEEISDRTIPLVAVVAGITENQLEQAIWFERSVFFTATGRTVELERAMAEFERLNALVASELVKSVAVTESALTASRNVSSRDGFRDIRRSLEETSTQRGLYEQTANQILALMGQGTQADSATAQIERSLSALRELEDLVHEELEALRAGLVVHTEVIAREMLTVKRLIVVFAIWGATVVLAGMTAMPLMVFSWKRDVEREKNL